MRTFERASAGLIGGALAAGVLLSAGCGNEPDLCESRIESEQLYLGDVGMDDDNQDVWRSGVIISPPPIRLLAKGVLYATVGYNVPDHGEAWHESEPIPFTKYQKGILMKIGAHGLRLSVTVHATSDSAACTVKPPFLFGNKVPLKQPNGKTLGKGLVKPVFND